MDEQFRSPVDVLAVLRRDESVLLMKRAGDRPGSGTWAVPSGKVDPGEDVVTAVRRELGEELGLTVDQADVRFFTVTHARPPGGEARVGFGFEIARWSGEPENREPEKCSALRWWPLTQLPEPTLGYTRMLLQLYRQKQPFRLAGWEPSVEEP